MQSYENLVSQVYREGVDKNNRTGIKTRGIFGAMLKHDCVKGFPLLTGKYVPIKLVAIELEGFIKGITDKAWYVKQGCPIWNQWCNENSSEFHANIDSITQKYVEAGFKISPSIVADIKHEAALITNDLGPVYGYQWRYWDGDYSNAGIHGVDQLKMVIEELKRNPDSRRLLVSAWNPRQIKDMALPPCHYAFQLDQEESGELSIKFEMRSVDLMLGLPFNIASYALLLYLICNETGMRPRHVVASLGDTHIYHNHFEGMKKYFGNEKYPLPEIHLMEPGKSTLDFNWQDVSTVGYEHSGVIKMPVAV